MSAYACEECGQRGDERPGLRLTGGTLEAVWAQDEVVAIQHVECLKCGHTRPIAAGSIEVRKA